MSKYKLRVLTLQLSGDADSLEKTRASVAGAGKGTKGRHGRVGKDTGASAWGWMARGRTLPLTS